MTITFEGNAMRGVGPGDRLWTVLLADLCIVGEFTTDYGPFLEDWHLAFVCRDGSWEECPLTNAGFDVLGELAARFNCGQLVPMLWGSAGCASRIIWPPSGDDPLFEFRWNDSENWERRLRSAMSGEPNPEGRSLSPQAHEMLHRLTE